MSEYFSESIVEQAALAWLESRGYRILSGPAIAPGEAAAERADYGQVVLERRLRRALEQLNPHIPAEALQDAFRKLTRPDSPSLAVNNHTMHRSFTDGVPVEYRRPDGSFAGDQAKVFDFDNPENNDFLAVNQFTVVEDRHERRPDIVIFVNGLPLAVIELKNAADEGADLGKAYNQLQTYKQQIPSLFNYNEALVISDGAGARVGTLTANREWFLPWRTIEGDEIADTRLSPLQVMLEGVFDKRRFLELIRYFIVFEESGGGNLAKKMAGYHQFHAVNVALAETLRASGHSDETAMVKEAGGTYFARSDSKARPGDRKVGVVWHTQGAGKSLTMAFYAGKVARHLPMLNPTLVVITDRNDLDHQLFDTFCRCHELLGQQPKQAQNRAQLRELLHTGSGGVIFTTLQKFLPFEDEDRFPQLSERHNIVVIADEAHRSQYGFGRHGNMKTGALADGFAHHLREALPNASFIGFTGTPIELADKNTRNVFGEYISIYDIQRAVADGATVPIYYESRWTKLALEEAEKPKLDDDFEEVTEGEEIEQKEKLKSRWSQMAELVGTPKRLSLIAADLVKHFAQRQEAIRGKAMIVCMSRRICVDLYDRIIELHPEWHDADDLKGAIKIVMTGSASDPLEWQQHSRTKERRENLAKRFKDPDDPLQLVIVRDMWLTGFDAPCLHTMYIDKPMRGHTLMQAIARVNRVFENKPGGLVVDYIGLAAQLQQAVSNYTDSGGTGDTAILQDEALKALRLHYEVCLGLFHGFDWSVWANGTPQDRLTLLPAAQEHILKLENGKERLIKAVTALWQAFKLASPHDEAMALRDDVSFFVTVKAVLSKTEREAARRSAEEMDLAIRQLVSKAIATEGVIDIFAAAGLKKPDISILSEEFLNEVRTMPQQNLAVELLRRLLEDEIKTRGRKNLVQARSFRELLEKAIRAYLNRLITSAQVIQEMIDLAGDMREAQQRGEKLGLSEDEVAFYDALEVNDSAVKIMGDEALRQIARELLQQVRSSVTIDWSIRENIRSRMRVLIKRILRRHGYPPDKQEKATETVIKQAEHLCVDWAVAG